MQEVYTEFCEDERSKMRYKDNTEMDFSKTRLLGWEVDGTSSRSCPVVGFDVSGGEPFDSTIRELDNKI
jgi:hypothetical protein